MPDHSNSPGRAAEPKPKPKSRPSVRCCFCSTRYPEAFLGGAATGCGVKCATVLVVEDASKRVFFVSQRGSAFERAIFEVVSERHRFVILNGYAVAAAALWPPSCDDCIKMMVAMDQLRQVQIPPDLGGWQSPLDVVAAVTARESAAAARERERAVERALGKFNFRLAAQIYQVAGRLDPDGGAPSPSALQLRARKMLASMRRPSASEPPVRASSNGICAEMGHHHISIWVEALHSTDFDPTAEGPAPAGAAPTSSERRATP